MIPAAANRTPVRESALPQASLSQAIDTRTAAAGCTAAGCRGRRNLPVHTGLEAARLNTKSKSGDEFGAKPYAS